MNNSKKSFGRIGLQAYKTLATIKAGEIYNYNDFDKELIQELKYNGYVKVWSDMFGTFVCLVGTKNHMQLSRF